DTNFNVAYLGGAGANENNLGFTKGGTGVMTLSGTPTYNGNTTNNTGTLRITSPNNIPGGAGKGNVAVTSGGLDLNGNSININGLFGSGTVSNGSVTAVTLTLGNNNATATFAGTIVDGAGQVALEKTGSGTQTL